MKFVVKAYQAPVTPKFFVWPDMDLYKVQVKGHYRKLSNGKIVRIESYHDKRRAAQKDPKKFEGKVVHADEAGTTTVTTTGKQIHHPHDKSKQLTDEDKTAHLTQALPVDEDLAFKVALRHFGIKEKDFPSVIKKMVEDERKKDDPEFTDVKGASKHWDKTFVRPILKDLRKKHGEVTTYAHAYTNSQDDTMKNYLDATAKDEDAPSHDQAMASLAGEHSEKALDDLAHEAALMKVVKSLKPEDCPEIAGVSKNIKFFGHQAEVLAKLNVLNKAIVDVDMGGGKGLLLPADALNLMAQGKVKRPLIVAPGATVDQNASKIVQEYTEGGVNVFKITNQTIRDHYDGDVEKMVEDIKNAPPNTIFMASYDAFAYQSIDKATGKPMEGEDRFQRAQALAAAEFDYCAMDECFHPLTPVDTIDGVKPIKDIRVGDWVKSCLGFSQVMATRYKKLDKRVVLEYNDTRITCSARHPFLTPKGWVLASHLKEGDLLVTTSEAMRVVQDSLYSEVESGRDEQVAFLRDFLLSEMAYERYTEVSRLFESGGQDQQVLEGESEAGSSASILDANEGQKPHVKPCDTPEDALDIARYWAQACGAIPEAENASREDLARRIGFDVDVGASCWQSLSDRLGLSSLENSRRSGRSFSSEPEGAREGRDEGHIPGLVRVVRLTIHEQGSDDTNPEGLFYDLSIKGHPSFSVAGVLVRNSHSIKNPSTSRWKAMQYLTRCKYKRVASGTFVSNNPADVIGQVKWLHPNWKMSEEGFKKEYGFEQDKTGSRWGENGLKKMREDLEGMGMISLRRSAWMHQLPERDEKLSIVKMTSEHAAVNELAINDWLDQIEEEMRKNPRLAKAMEGEDADEMLEENPSLAGGLNVLGGITDYPDIMANLVDNAYKTLRESDGGADEADPESDFQQARNFLNRFKPNVRKALRSLKGMVSPKAKDVYAKAEEHLKDPKNGKFIVFVQRKFSAQHILDHMPEHLKKQAMYFDASKMDELPSFTKDPNGPKILVAVDASVKEGINMQNANGMYRYDHHFSPGSQEQSYARIWRFGQDKACKFHLGVVDGGVDVTKYCRMMSKHHQNIMMTSDMPASETEVSYKLSLDNIRNHRNALETDDFQPLGKEIMDFQHGENKELKKRYGSKPLDKATGATIGGKKADTKHGQGAYHTEFVGDEKVARLDPSEKDRVKGLFQDALKKHYGDKEAYRDDHWDVFFPEAMELAQRMKLKNQIGQPMDDKTWKSYEGEYEHLSKEKLEPKEKKLLREVVDNFSTGKKHTPHDKHDYDAALNLSFETHKVNPPAKAKKEAAEDLKSALEYIKKKKIDLVHIGLGKADDPDALDGFWKEWSKKYDDEPSEKQRKIIAGTAAMLQEYGKGYEGMKDRYEDPEDEDK